MARRGGGNAQRRQACQAPDRARQRAVDRDAPEISADHGARERGLAEEAVCCANDLTRPSRPATAYQGISGPPGMPGLLAHSLAAVIAHESGGRPRLGSNGRTWRTLRQRGMSLLMHGLHFAGTGAHKVRRCLRLPMDAGRVPDTAEPLRDLPWSRRQRTASATPALRKHQRQRWPDATIAGVRDCQP